MCRKLSEAWVTMSADVLRLREVAVVVATIGDGSRHRVFGAAFVVLAAAGAGILVAGCTAGSTTGRAAGNTGSSSSTDTSPVAGSPSSTQAAPAPVIAASWKSGAKLSPSEPVSVTVTSGRLTSVVLI